MTETPEQHARANPGHVIKTAIDQPTICDRGDYRSPLMDLTDAWKFGGYEVMTHQEALRRQARVELMDPLWRQARPEMADVFDSMIKPAPWDSPDAQAAADRLTADVARMSAEVARRRDEQLAPYVEAIESLRESGVDVWLEETPPKFETVATDDEKVTFRVTATARLRYTGDGLD